MPHRWNFCALPALPFIPQSQEYCVASSNPMDKAAAAFKKEEQKREGEKNMLEFRQAQIAVQQKTERLRALRLAHEARQAESETVEATPAAKPKVATRPRTAAKRKTAVS
jgi:hypothetical protein